jgi:Uma2 family endonuclease
MISARLAIKSHWYIINTGVQLMENVYNGIYIDGDNGLDNMIHLMAYPTWKHEKTISGFIYQLEHFFQKKPCGVFGSNTGLFIGHRWEQIEHLKSVQKAFKEQIVESKQEHISISPDIQVICNYKSSDFDYRGYHGIPKLVIEVHSPSTGIDDTTWKKDIYEAFGILEYWIIQDIENVGVFRLVDGEYFLTKYQTSIEEDILEVPSHIFDGLVIKLNRRDILDYE